MQFEDLKHAGIYVLTRDVTNPKPDRRQKYDGAALAVWKAGTRFAFIDRKFKDFPVELRVGGMYGPMHRSDPGFDLVVDALEAAPRTLQTVLEGIKASSGGVFADAILRELVRSGKISLEDVERAHADELLRDDRDDEDA